MLPIITTFFNYAKSKRKVELINRLKAQSEDWVNSELYIVELSYDGEFEVTEADNPNHLQLKTEQPMFQKENLINLVIQKLLPKYWSYFAFIDSDINIPLEENDRDWEARIINTLHDSTPLIIQPWSSCYDLGPTDKVIAIQKPILRQHCGHPGYFWAMNRSAYDKIGGLYDKFIVGSGDSLLAYCLLRKQFSDSHGQFLTPEFAKNIDNYFSKFSGIEFDFVELHIEHSWHGNKMLRRYYSRWEMLKGYEPEKHLSYNSDGLLVCTKEFPEKLKTDLIEYFHSRKEE